MSGYGAVRCAKGEARHEPRQGRQDSTGWWQAGQDRTGQARHTRQGRQHGSASESLHHLDHLDHPSKALPRPFEKEYRTTLPAVPAPLIVRYGHAYVSVQSNPPCTCFALPCPVLPSLFPSRRPRALQAISRSLSQGCSLPHAKWNNLVIIARSEGCHRCRPNHHLSAKEASNFSAPMPVVRRYF